ncbi:hypothetical protein ACTXT7_001494 [Hymenolepis weldensis]
MVHFGHANVIRQAKCLGNYLIAGLHSDSEIAKHKGPPVFTQEERYILLKSIKWVDEVVKDAPYMTQLEVLKEYKCDFCVHGSDISITEDGQDAYEIVKNAGKYVSVEVPRTEGISSTDLLYRIIRAFKQCKLKSSELDNCFNSVACQSISAYTSGTTHYLPNILRIAQFSSSSNGHILDTLSTGNLEGIRPPNPGERIVYVPGAFDLMHVGHVKFLEKCRELGTYIIVGLHSDEVFNALQISHGKAARSPTLPKFPLIRRITEQEQPAIKGKTKKAMMVFTIQQIKPSWSELFVITESSVLSGLHIVDIAAMWLGDYGSRPLAI